MRQWKFRIPLEGKTQEIPLRRYVQWAWPEASLTQVDALFERGGVEADAILVTRPDRPMAPDTTVEFQTDEPGDRTYGVPEADALLRGQGWVIVDKPAGIPGQMTEEDPTDPIRFMADVLGLDRSEVKPLWHTPAGASGPWLLAIGQESAQQLGEEILNGRLQSSWHAIIPRPPRAQGRWSTKWGEVEFAVTRTKGELAEIQLQPKWQGVEEAEEIYFRLLEMIAEAHSPVLGDTLHGGYLVPGDLRLRLGAIYGTEQFAHSWPAPRDWWPEEPVLMPVTTPTTAPGAEVADTIVALEVPARVLTRIKEGYPWVMHDPALRGMEGLRPGAMVRLVGPEGPLDLYALVDGLGPVAARKWSTTREEAQDFSAEVAIRLDEAIGRRRGFFRQMGTTDVFRLVHGEADGLPGVVIDRLGSIIRVALVGRCASAYGDLLYEHFKELEPEATILEVIAYGEGKRAPKVRVVQQGFAASTPADPVILRERGLRYLVDPRRPFDEELTCDHRENRRVASERAKKGQRWLVACADGGSFAVALAKEGVATTHLHPSRDRIDKTDNNFELNGLSETLTEHVEGDLATYLEREIRRFDGIVVDVRAMGSVAQPGSFETLIDKCLDALEPGGWLLFSRRHPGRGESTLERVEKWLEQTQRSVALVEEAPPSQDFPRLEGFTEGDPFQGVWIRLAT